MAGRPPAIQKAAICEALAETGTLVAAAQRLGVSSAALTARAKQDADIRRALESQQVRRREALVASIRQHRGILSRVAEELGFVDAASVRYYIYRDPQLRAVWDDARGRVVDKAEENVFAAVEAGNLKYSWHLLQTLGKDRGYTERRELEGHIVHETREASTAELLSSLAGMMVQEADAVQEATAELPEGDRALLGAALAREGVGAPTALVEAPALAPEEKQNA